MTDFLMTAQIEVHSLLLVVKLAIMTWLNTILSVIITVRLNANQNTNYRAWKLVPHTHKLDRPQNRTSHLNMTQDSTRKNTPYERK